MVSRRVTLFGGLCFVAASSSLLAAGGWPRSILMAAPAGFGATLPSDVAHPAGLPSIGKWMIDSDGAIAHWLGEAVDGKALREPINIIILDSISKSSAEAVQRIQSASAAAGYPVRRGHSAGYRAIIGGQLFPQIPQAHDSAFSNRVFELTNNHGRLFGPLAFDKGYVFVGAFSREEVRAKAPRHAYASFNQARDDYAQKLDLKTGFKRAAFVALENAIVGGGTVSTGDHDGIAVLLHASGG